LCSGPERREVFCVEGNGEIPPYYSQIKWEMPPWSRNISACPARLSTPQILAMWRECSHEARFSSANFSVEKSQFPRRSVSPRAGSASFLRYVASTQPSPSLWVGLKLKIRKIPALVDAGAQFCCLYSDVIDYIYHRGERCTFFPCTL